MPASYNYQNLMDLLKQLHSFRLDAEMARVCDRCGMVTSQPKGCGTCDAMPYAEGDAFTATCSHCDRGFVTADHHRDLCCFCMKRAGERNGRNRTTRASSPRHSDRAAHQGPGRTFPSWLTRRGARDSLESAGIRTGEIIAWRAWLAINTPNGLLLRSMAVDCAWEPGEVVSADSILEQCGYRDRWARLPIGIGAGIHAFKSLVEATRQYQPQSQVVFGTVALWGEVIEHELGYRAEFGRVNTLDYIGDMDPEEQPLLEHLRRTYGVAGKSHMDFQIN